MVLGKALIYSLSSLQERGRLMINHGDQVYQGQIIGAASNDNDLWVNCRQRQEPRLECGER
ncbi:hypothetical protein [Photobacterium leiognathi]|uniref:hypothetical protein n=1 Tax=Photobacterium leiognathi TaxID=553611 RepID=UPI0034E44B11